MHWIVSADLRGDGQLLWCAMAAPKLGDNLAIGLTVDGKELWNYSLPAGVQPQPIEPIIVGKLPAPAPASGFCPGPTVPSTSSRPTASRGTSSTRA